MYEMLIYNISSFRRCVTLHFFLNIVRHLDQAEPVKYRVYVSHTPDIAKCFRSSNRRHLLTGTALYLCHFLKSQPDRAPGQTLTVFSAVNKKFFCIIAVFPQFKLLGKRQA